jgi:hypothetical protein
MKKTLFGTPTVVFLFTLGLLLSFLLAPQAIDNIIGTTAGIDKASFALFEKRSETANPLERMHMKRFLSKCFKDLKVNALNNPTIPFKLKFESVKNTYALDRLNICTKNYVLSATSAEDLHRRNDIAGMDL